MSGILQLQMFIFIVLVVKFYCFIFVVVYVKTSTGIVRIVALCIAKNFSNCRMYLCLSFKTLFNYNLIQFELNGLRVMNICINYYPIVFRLFSK